MEMDSRSQEGVQQDNRTEEGILQNEARDVASTDRKNSCRTNAVGHSHTSLANQGEAATTTKGSNIDALVAKAQKAASTLWTMLHAKNCRLGLNRCSQPGCHEAKLLHLHFKTCVAGPGAPCPTKQKGCDDARRLLAHYRRCREMRARRAGQYPRGKQHSCLICTSLARQAKLMLDRNRSTSPRKTNPKHTLSSLNQNAYGKVTIQNVPDVPNLMRPRPRSTSPPRSNGRHAKYSYTASADAELHSSKSSSPLKMLPPPPRNPKWSQSPFTATPQTLTEEQSPHSVIGNSTTDFPRRSFELATTLAERASDELHIPQSESLEIRRKIPFLGKHRPRAESLDIRRAITNPSQHSGLQGDCEGGSSELDSAPTIHRRQRSASCSVLLTSSASVLPGGCDTIHEEGLGEESMLEDPLGETEYNSIFSKYGNAVRRG